MFHRKVDFMTATIAGLYDIPLLPAPTPHRINLCLSVLLRGCYRL